MTIKVNVGSVIMILRVYALYARSRLILAFLMGLWILQITLSSITMKLGFREHAYIYITVLYIHLIYS